MRDPARRDASSRSSLHVASRPGEADVSVTCPLGKNVVAGGGRAVELIDQSNRQG